MTHQIFFQIECNHQNFPSEQEVRRWVNAALPNQPSYEINVRLVNPDEMQQLNQSYRKKDGVTDILSFPFHPPEGFETNFLGDIVLCPARVNADAENQHKQNSDHWAHLLVHGTLHLLGMDHYTDKDAEKMMAREIEILTQLNVPNPYERSL